jgi:integrase
MPIGGIRPRHVAEYVAKQAEHYEASTVSRDLSVLHDLFATAMREELIETNPAAGAEHPKKGKRRWRILQPAEVSRLLRAFDDEQARTIFLTLVLTAIRRNELRNLRWGDVNLLERTLRVEDSKTEEGIRSIALSPALVSALEQHYQQTSFKGEGEFVFCHSQRGTRYSEKLFAEQFRAALAVAGITDYVRPFHDLRHTALTNEAASGSSPIALMTKAGHTDMKTTRIYLHLAGTVFREEAAALERRLFGASTDSASEAGDVGGCADADGAYESQDVRRGAGPADAAASLSGGCQIDGAIDQGERPRLSLRQHSSSVPRGVESSTRLSESQRTSDDADGLE